MVVACTSSESIEEYSETESDGEEQGNDNEADADNHPAVKDS